MIKVQFFLLIETLIFSLAIFDALASSSTRLLLALAILLLLIWLFLRREKLNILAISAGVILFLVFALNAYFVLGCLLAIVYGFVNAFARFRKRSQYIPVDLNEEVQVVTNEKTKWIGDQDLTQDKYGFEDVNIIRTFGTDIIDLDRSIVAGGDNMVVIRKIYGKTKVIVPIDVEVMLSASSLYGDVHFVDGSAWALRNESIAVKTGQYSQSHRRVKVMVNTLYGDVEVVRV